MKKILSLALALLMASPAFAEQTVSGGVVSLLNQSIDAKGTFPPGNANYTGGTGLAIGPSGTGNALFAADYGAANANRRVTLKRFYLSCPMTSYTQAGAIQLRVFSGTLSVSVTDGAAPSLVAADAVKELATGALANVGNLFPMPSFRVALSDDVTLDTSGKLYFMLLSPGSTGPNWTTPGVCAWRLTVAF